MRKKIKFILENVGIDENELAKMLFPHHKHPMFALRDVIKGIRELRESEIYMVNTLARANMIGQFFCMPKETGKPGLWLRYRRWEVAIIGNEAIIYKHGELMDRIAIDPTQKLEDFLLSCLDIFMDKFEFENPVRYE